jgi:hypothetical protein
MGQRPEQIPDQIKYLDANKYMKGCSTPYAIKELQIQQ